MSIFPAGRSAQSEKKGEATRWNANSFNTVKCNSFRQSTLKCHNITFHEKVATIIFEIIFRKKAYCINGWHRLSKEKKIFN